MVPMTEKEGEVGARPARKRVALLSVLIAGVAVVTVAAIMAQQPLREQYWLWRLKSAATAEERQPAVERLGELGSIRAIPSLIETVTAELSAIGGNGALSRQGPRPYVDAIRSISDRAPERSKQLLQTYLSDDRPIPRAVAATVLFDDRR